MPHPACAMLDSAIVKLCAPRRPRQSQGARGSSQDKKKKEAEGTRRRSTHLRREGGGGVSDLGADAVEEARVGVEVQRQQRPELRHPDSSVRLQRTRRRTRRRGKTHGHGDVGGVKEGCAVHRTRRQRGHQLLVVASSYSAFAAAAARLELHERPEQSADVLWIQVILHGQTPGSSIPNRS
eukprot:582895-Rhodomonas_salina.6